MSERLFLRLDEDVSFGPESTVPAGTLDAFAVPTLLREHVSQILRYRELIPAGLEVSEHVIPDGAARLVLNLGDAPSGPDSPAVVIGASAEPARVRLRGRLDGLSIALRPGASAALLGVPACELADRVVPLDVFWGRGASELVEQVGSARDDATRAAIVEAALRRRLREAVPEDARATVRAARVIASSGGRASVREAASELGLGERRLQQLFRLHVGLTPRTWGRLARVHGVLRQLRGLRRPAWARVAVDHGFYDQAHLANEFRALCGVTPTEFLRRTVSRSSKPPP